MTDLVLLSSARAGDRAAFGRLVDPFVRELTVHSYRMLGSLADAEDAVQDTLLRAWQALATFEGRSSIRTWLYKIATNACLDAIDRRKVRTLPHVVTPPGDPRGAIPSPSSEHAYLGPIPDALLPAPLSVHAEPEARYSMRESVALAFLAILQKLPGRQRATLVLRDVLGMSANEAAEVLGMTVPSVNSALQRARETIDHESGSDSDDAKAARLDFEDDAAAQDLLKRFVVAWEAGDTAAIASALRADTVFSMPPFPLWLHGRDAVRTFLDGFLFAGPGASSRYRILPTRANGLPALAVYQRASGDDARFVPAAIDVITIRGDGIRELVAFLTVDPGLSFARFGLPDALPG